MSGYSLLEAFQVHTSGAWFLGFIWQSTGGMVGVGGDGQREEQLLLSLS